MVELFIKTSHHCFLEWLSHRNDCREWSLYTFRSVPKLSYRNRTRSVLRAAKKFLLPFTVAKLLHKKTAESARQSFGSANSRNANTNESALLETVFFTNCREIEFLSCEFYHPRANVQLQDLKYSERVLLTSSQWSSETKILTATLVSSTEAALFFSVRLNI